MNRTSPLFADADNQYKCSMVVCVLVRMGCFGVILRQEPQLPYGLVTGWGTRIPNGERRYILYTHPFNDITQ